MSTRSRTIVKPSHYNVVDSLSKRSPEELAEIHSDMTRLSLENPDSAVILKCFQITNLIHQQKSSRTTAPRRRDVL